MSQTALPLQNPTFDLAQVVSTLFHLLSSEFCFDWLREPRENQGAAEEKLMTKSLTALALFALTIVSPVAAYRERDDRTPDLGTCQQLRVEAGNRVALHAYAEGVQIYRWNGTSWTFIAPDAQLFPDDDARTQAFGIHYAGPTWESRSGSSVRGTLDGLCVPDPNALPWLRLRAVSSEGPGLFLGTTFIHRLNTVGGIAPTLPGSVVGEEARVPYTADYYFYKAHP